MKDSDRRKATALAVGAGLLVAVIGLPFAGPFAILLGAGAFHWSLRPLMRRFGTPSPDDLAKATRASIWAVVPLTALLGGFLALLMSWNPDGYMQPKPSSSQVWSVVLAGGTVGAVAGLLLAMLFRAFHAIFIGKAKS